MGSLDGAHRERQQGIPRRPPAAGPGYASRGRRPSGASAPSDERLGDGREVGAGLGQLRLERVQPVGQRRLVVLEHDQVVAEVGLDGTHDVARLEGVDVVEQGVGELGDHGGPRRSSPGRRPSAPLPVSSLCALAIGREGRLASRHVRDAAQLLEGQAGLRLGDRPRGIGGRDAAGACRCCRTAPRPGRPRVTTGCGWRGPCRCRYPPRWCHRRARSGRGGAAAGRPSWHPRRWSRRAWPRPSPCARCSR